MEPDQWGLSYGPPFTGDKRSVLDEGDEAVRLSKRQCTQPGTGYLNDGTGTTSDQAVSAWGHEKGASVGFMNSYYQSANNAYTPEMFTAQHTAQTISWSGWTGPATDNYPPYQRWDGATQVQYDETRTLPSSSRYTTKSFTAESALPIVDQTYSECGNDSTFADGNHQQTAGVDTFVPATMKSGWHCGARSNSTSWEGSTETPLQLRCDPPIDQLPGAEESLWHIKQEVASDSHSQIVSTPRDSAVGTDKICSGELSTANWTLHSILGSHG